MKISFTYFSPNDSESLLCYLYAIISLIGRMLERYNKLKDTLTLAGYDEALKLVDDLPA